MQRQVYAAKSNDAVRHHCLADHIINGRSAYHVTCVFLIHTSPPPTGSRVRCEGFFPITAIATTQLPSEHPVAVAAAAGSIEGVLSSSLIAITLWTLRYHLSFSVPPPTFTFTHLTGLELVETVKWIMRRLVVLPIKEVDGCASVSA